MNISWTVEQVENDFDGIYNITLILNASESLGSIYFSYLVNVMPETSYTFIDSKMKIIIDALPNVTYNVSVATIPRCRSAEKTVHL